MIDAFVIIIIWRTTLFNAASIRVSLFYLIWLQMIHRDTVIVIIVIIITTIVSMSWDFVIYPNIISNLTCPSLRH